ncbi:MAG TPA: glycoside hydrolase family 38 C-terminal domain-containing protein, partial [Anaerolineae bacterium]|nr:glycoside hydrolase family 38 C-terminal domain-containing protein [Anaerolineae bacterium]
EDVKGLWDQYRQKEINDELLMLFGWGDGGGGPTKEMLESARVLRDLPGFPRVRQGPAESFFARLEERLEGRDVPAWDGELYLEYHRGTYTSQAQVKRANRRAEVTYHDAEALSAMVCLLTGEHDYPAAELREGWEAILLNQFHDILPGSSIRAVYDDCADDYCRILGLGEAAIERAQGAIAARVAAAGPGAVVFNGLSWARDGLVALSWWEGLEGKTLRGPDGEPAPAQVVDEGGEKRLLVQVPGVPALGYRVYPLCDAAAGQGTGLTVSTTLLENEYYRAALDERGQITSLVDKRCAREVVPPGKRANVFQAFEDRPMDFDAWDIDIYYREKMVEVTDLVEAAVEEAGPVRGTLRLTWRFYDSTIVQRVTLYAGSRRIDFRTEVDWQERQVLLKVAFPADVRATKAAYDIQFGAIERPTHSNTSWDRARFEVVGHKWADLSEGDYGVALLNDCKYGHDVDAGVLRLSLIKSAVDPDPEADRGQHAFTYSLLPHAGGWRTGGVVEEGYALNNPLRAVVVAGAQASDLPAAYSHARVDAGHVIVETIKQAEDGDGWIVRAYESRQYRNPAVRLTMGRAVRRAVECNLVEEGDAAVDWRGDSLTFPIAPFEIKTFRVWF